MTDIVFEAEVDARGTTVLVYANLDIDPNPAKVGEIAIGNGVPVNMRRDVAQQLAAAISRRAPTRLT